MKKHIILSAVCMAVVVLFTSASKPSLDGRALVAASGELPPGLYIKAAAFLPGDSVIITNPSAKVSVEAMVFSTFSTSEGIAAVLSQETAKRLFIEKDSNSVVQITKNGGDMELSVLSKAMNSAYENQLTEQPLPDDGEQYNMSAADENTAVAMVDEPAGGANDKVFTPFADAAPSSAQSTKTESAAQPDKINIPEYDDVPSAMDGAAEQSSLVSDEPMPETVLPEKNSMTEQENPVVTKAETSADDVVPDDVASKNVSETSAAESVPNVLLPADENPPPTFDDTAMQNESAVEPDSAMFGRESEEKPPIEETAGFNYADIRKYVINDIREFGTGAYCVQLAAYKDAANIARVLDRFADKYPVRLAASEKISGAYQVLIGPLNKDEYPVVLKRFIAWGFKDAFLRRVR